LSIPGGLAAAIAAAARHGPNRAAPTDLLIQTVILLSCDGPPAGCRTAIIIDDRTLAGALDIDRIC
jgi:hypothetical protein